MVESALSQAPKWLAKNKARVTWLCSRRTLLLQTGGHAECCRSQRQGAANVNVRCHTSSAPAGRCERARGLWNCARAVWPKCQLPVVASSEVRRDSRSSVPPRGISITQRRTPGLLHHKHPRSKQILAPTPPLRCPALPCAPPRWCPIVCVCVSVCVSVCVCVRARACVCVRA